MQYRNLLSSISLILFAFSCTKIEYIEVPVDVPVHDSLIIKVEKDETGYFGASGFVNGIKKEYQGAEFSFYTSGNDERMGFEIASFEWIENVIWAHREIITIINLSQSSIGDTVQLESLENVFEDIPFAHIFHAYLDGDAVAECYKILNDDQSDSWFLLTEYDMISGELAGTIHADYVISDICPPKYDPSQPDTIRIRDFWFRAKLRE